VSGHGPDWLPTINRVTLFGSREGSSDEGAVPGPRQDGLVEFVMARLVLVVSGVLEAAWAVALGKSEGFSRLIPFLVFLVGIIFYGGADVAVRGGG
jgi:hypothetical protein